MKVLFRILFSDIDGYEQMTEYNIPGYFPDIFVNHLHVERDKISKYFISKSELCFSIEISDETDLESVQNLILQDYGIDLEWGTMNCSVLYLLIDGEMIFIGNLSIKLNDVLAYYGHQDVLNIFWVFSKYQGVVFKEGNIQYSMHSNESNHNEPHVHVSVDGKQCASVNIRDGSIICGSIPAGKKKEVIDTIKNHTKMFIDYWNKRTNGIYVDIDYSLGTATLKLKQ